jgi:hypothetical protein
VEESEYGNYTGGDTPCVGVGTAGGDQFGILSEAGDEPDGESDEPGAHDEASGGGGFAYADEAIAETAGLGNLTAGVDKVTEAEEIEDREGGEQGESDYEGKESKECIKGGADVMEAAGPPVAGGCRVVWCWDVARAGDGGDVRHGDELQQPADVLCYTTRHAAMQVSNIFWK